MQRLYIKDGAMSAAGITNLMNAAIIGRNHDNL